MAKYWVGGTGNTNDPTNHWATTSGGSPGAGNAPTASDDIFFDANSGAGTVTVNAALTGRSLQSPGSSMATLVHNAATAITLGDGTAGAGNKAIDLSGFTTYTLGSNTSSTVSFVSSSTTLQTITMGGKIAGNWSLSASGKWQFADAYANTASSTFTQSAGTLDTNNQTVTWAAYNSSNTQNRTLTLGSSAITITSSGTPWNLATTTNLTVTANTATVTFNTTAALTFSTATFNYNGMSVVYTGGAGFTIANGAPTLANFTYTGTAVKTGSIALGTSTNPVITGTFTVSGNSAINRVLVQSGVVGSSRTITAAAVSLTNVDFQDITGAGLAGNAAWTGSSMGDALGNSNITFDAPATQTHTASAGGNWSDVTKWTSRVPLPQDNVVVDVNTTGTLTADMPRLGANLTFTGFAGTFTNSVATASYGNITLASGMTISGTAAWVWSGRGSHTVTSAGRTFTQAVQMNTSIGTYTLQDALIIDRATTSFNHISGTLDANNFNVTFPNATASYSNTAGTLNMGSGTWSIGTSGAQTFWTFAAGTTLNHQNSTIVLTAASTSTRTFNGAGKSYGTLQYTVANSPGSLTIQGANTFTNLNVASGRILTMPASTTNTIASGGTFNVNGAVNGYVYLPGVTGNSASTPEASAIRISGDIDIRVRCTLDDWTPAAVQVLIAKEDANYGYRLHVTTGGLLTFTWSDNNSTNRAISSTAATGISDGSLAWVRVTRASGTGTTKFYTSTTSTNDPTAVTWTQLGTDVASFAGAMFNNITSALYVGLLNGNSLFMIGKMYRSAIYTTIDGSTPVFDADFTTKTVGANSFTESSANAATVTINGTLAQAGDGRVSLVSSTPGTAATLTKPGVAIVEVDYLSIQDSTVTGNATLWYAGSHSINVSGNTGWIFTAFNGRLPVENRRVLGTGRVASTRTQASIGRVLQ